MNLSRILARELLLVALVITASLAFAQSSKEEGTPIAKSDLTSLTSADLIFKPPPPPPPQPRRDDGGHTRS